MGAQNVPLERNTALCQFLGLPINCPAGADAIVCNVSVPNLDKPEPKKIKNQKLDFLFFHLNPHPCYVTASSEKYIAKIY
jgi:hypothetical protein